MKQSTVGVVTGQLTYGEVQREVRKREYLTKKLQSALKSMDFHRNHLDFDMRHARLNPEFDPNVKSVAREMFHQALEVITLLETLQINPQVQAVVDSYLERRA